MTLTVGAGGKGGRGVKLVQCGSKAVVRGCLEAPGMGAKGGGAVRAKGSEMGATGDLVGGGLPTLGEVRSSSSSSGVSSDEVKGFMSEIA